MSDDKPAEQKTEPEAPSAPAAAPASEAPTRSEHHSSGSGASQMDYNPHFEKMFQELGKLPESLINALREAVPEQPKQEAEAPADEAEEPAAVVPGKTKHKVSAPATKAADTPTKRSFASRWLGQ